MPRTDVATKLQQGVHYSAKTMYDKK